MNLHLSGLKVRGAGERFGLLWMAQTQFITPAPLGMR